MVIIEIIEILMLDKPLSELRRFRDVSTAGPFGGSEEVQRLQSADVLGAQHSSLRKNYSNVYFRPI